MTKYSNRGGKSNVIAYLLGSDAITVMFVGGVLYHYTQKSAGQSNIARMKELAVNGIGLNSFINRTVKKRYAYTTYVKR